MNGICDVCGQPTRSKYGVCQRTPACKVECNVRYRTANPEQRRATDARYREKNPERIRGYQRAWRENNRESYNAYSNEYFQKVRKGSAQYLLDTARSRAKKSGIPCTITVDDIVIPDVCPILGMPLVTGDKDAGPTLDKIIPELGYVPGNVQVVSNLANRMKSNATPEQLLAFANWVTGQERG